MNRIFINFANRYRELGTDTDAPESHPPRP